MLIQWASTHNKYLDRRQKIQLNWWFHVYIFKYVNKNLITFPSRKSIHLFMLFLIYISSLKMYYLLSVFLTYNSKRGIISTIRNWTFLGKFNWHCWIIIYRKRCCWEREHVKHFLFLFHLSMNYTDWPINN